MSIVITGATGNLGGHVIDSLLGRGAGPGDIVAAGRNTGRLAELAALGVRTAPIDYDDLETLQAAFDGADRLLLISGSEVGSRVAQHGNAIDAARKVGVSHVIYTSILRADTSLLRLAAEHRATEEAVEEAGLGYTFLRNGWYLENYTAQIPTYLGHGGIVGSAGDGLISAATRADFAEAAAAVLVANGPDRAVFELGGDTAFTMAELADELSRQSGNQIAYQDLPGDQYTKVLLGAGLPQPLAETFADGDRGVSRGELYVDTGDLSSLIGRPTTTLSAAVAAALDGHRL